MYVLCNISKLSKCTFETINNDRIEMKISLFLHLFFAFIQKIAVALSTFFSVAVF